MCLNFVVKEDTLLDMVSCMTDDVGLVHQMPFTCDRDGFAATLEKVKFMYFCAEISNIHIYLNITGKIFSLTILLMNTVCSHADVESCIPSCKLHKKLSCKHKLLPVACGFRKMFLKVLSMYFYLYKYYVTNSRI